MSNRRNKFNIGVQVPDNMDYAHQLKNVYGKTLYNNSIIKDVAAFKEYESFESLPKSYAPPPGYKGIP